MHSQDLPHTAPLAPAVDQLAGWQQRLTAYAQGWLRGEPDHDVNITLKLDHCRRVLDEARRLLAADGSGPAHPAAVQAAALFHDVGRFPQYARWGTFRDAVSEDHGRLAARVVRSEGLLDDLPETLRIQALAAMVAHNRRRIPPGLPPALRACAGLVRDADKLDIFPIMLAHLAPGSEANPVVVLHLADQPTAYCPTMLEALRQRRMAAYAHMRSRNDFKLLLLSWVYDLNTQAARRFFLERDYVGRVLALLPELPDFAGLGSQLRADLALR